MSLSNGHLRCAPVYTEYDEIKRLYVDPKKGVPGFLALSSAVASKVLDKKWAFRTLPFG